MQGCVFLVALPVVGYAAVVCVVLSFNWFLLVGLCIQFFVLLLLLCLGVGVVALVFVPRLPLPLFVAYCVLPFPSLGLRASCLCGGLGFVGCAGLCLVPELLVPPSALVRLYVPLFILVFVSGRFLGGVLCAGP